MNQIIAGACEGQCARDLGRSLMPFAIVALIIFLVVTTLLIFGITVFYRHEKLTNPNGWVAKKSGKYILILIAVIAVILFTSGLYTYIDRQFTQKRVEASEKCIEESIYLNDPIYEYTPEYKNSLSECNRLRYKKWGF